MRENPNHHKIVYRVILTNYHRLNKAKAKIAQQETIILQLFLIGLRITIKDQMMTKRAKPLRSSKVQVQFLHREIHQLRNKKLVKKR